MPSNTVDMLFVILPSMLFVLMGQTCWACPDGAPASACITMKPMHYGTVPQQSDTLPYFTTFDKSSLNYDETLLITIKKKNDSIPPFQGFLMVAVGEMHGVPEHFVGMFSDFNEDAKAVDCIMGDGDAMPMTGVTHKNNTEKTSVTFKWRPNGFSGNVTFRATYAEHAGMYWVKQHSGIVQVFPAPPTPDGAESSWSTRHTFWAVMAPLLALTLMSF